MLRPTRRDLLAAGAGLAATLAFPAVLRRGLAVETPLEHIVLFMQENRSFDHYFGLFPGAEGYPACAPVRPAREYCILDPAHGISAARGEYQAMRAGADPVQVWGREALVYYTGQDLPWYWALADRFTLCDHYFCAALGGTDINRVMALAGDPGEVRENATLATAALPAESIVDRLEAAGLSWGCYCANLPATAENQVHYWPRWKRDPRTQLSLRQLAADASAGRLPAVSWIVTQPGVDEHPDADVSWGERFAAWVINTIASGLRWKATAIVLHYDENGGFYDHVLPPQVDQFGLGFRTPCIVVSPYARAGHVSSSVYEHASALALIERTFGLAPLGSRDRNANPFENAFDFSHAETSFVDYPAGRKLGTCSGVPDPWVAEIFERPVPSGGYAGRVPAARPLCGPQVPRFDVGAGLVAGAAVAATGAAALLTGRLGARPTTD